MDWVALSYAFVVGMATTVNPCGFVMLPAYLAWFAGPGQAGTGSALARAGRAVGAGLVVSAGFVVVFGLMGLAVSAGLSAVMAVVPGVMVAVGAGLMGLGVLVTSGRHVGLRLPGAARSLGGGGRGLRTMAGFGVSYGVASLACALPAFLAGVAGAFTRVGTATGAAAFLAFAIGMGTVLTASSVTVALAGPGALGRVRALGRRLERSAGVLLCLVGAYLVYYWATDLAGTQGSAFLVKAVDRAQSAVAGRIDAAGPALGIALGASVVAVVVALGAIGVRRHRPRSPRRPLWLRPALAIGLGLVMTGALAGGVHMALARAAGGGPAAIGPATAKLLGLDNLAGSAVRPAPDFTLTDQHGRPLSMAGLRGQAVVLSFNDNHCQELCPLYAQDVRAATSDLGALAGRVAFVGVNDNPFYPGVEAEVAFDQREGLTGVPGWHLLTGPLPELESVWRAYGTTPVTGPHDSVEHASVLFFIDPSGTIRSMGAYGPSSVQTSRWGHALAVMAEHLLGVRSAVGQVSVASPPPARSTAPAFSLARLGEPTAQKVSLTSLHGKPALVNFFASWCTACRAEAPTLEAAARRFARRVRFVGIDVDDARSSASAFVRHYHLTYPVGVDSNGEVAASYHASGLPITVFLSPSGAVVGRQVGAIGQKALLGQLHSMISGP